MSTITRPVFQKPAEYAEHRLITAILDGSYPPGATLPNERSLAAEIGVTRPTLRETLQRLSVAGWLDIRHGKATRVRDYWREGGLGILSTLARFGEHLPVSFVTHLLAFRADFLPAAIRQAVNRAPDRVWRLVEAQRTRSRETASLIRADWQIQAIIARESGNPVYAMILNDFEAIYEHMAAVYFAWPEARAASRRFHAELPEAIRQGPADAAAAVRAAMRESLDIWQRHVAALDPGESDTDDR